MSDFTPEHYIEITGVDLVTLIKKAYDLSSPQGMGFLHFKDEPMSDEEAKSQIREQGRYAVSMDYVAGRAVKFAVFREGDKLFIYNAWFDHRLHQLEKLLEAVGIKTSNDGERLSRLTT